MLTFMGSGAVTFVMFLLRYVAFDLQESPKYLIAKGRDQEAYEACHPVIYVFIHLMTHKGPSTHSKVQRQNNPAHLGRAASHRHLRHYASELLAAYQRIVGAPVNVRLTLDRLK